MTTTRTITRALIGEEDLLLGDSSVDPTTQTRNGSSLSITKINADGIPYSGDSSTSNVISIKTKIDTLSGVTSTITVSSSAHTAADDAVILADDDTAAGNITVTLPLAADAEDSVYYIKKLGSTGNIIIDGTSAETIDGSLTATITQKYQALTVVCDGSNWHIL